MRIEQLKAMIVDGSINEYELAELQALADGLGIKIGSQVGMTDLECLTNRKDV